MGVNRRCIYYEAGRESGRFLHTGAVAACQSGTSALHLSLIECKVEPGDMVIVPTLTFIAAVNPVRYQFAEPVLWIVMTVCVWIHKTALFL